MFPYIKEIHVNNCYTYKDFTILDNSEGNNFKHFILTGKNGSGKTTILKRIAFLLRKSVEGENVIVKTGLLKNALLAKPEEHSAKNSLPHYTDVELRFFSDFDTLFGSRSYDYFIKHKGQFVYSFIEDYRKTKVDAVETVTKETIGSPIFSPTRTNQDIVSKFKQYLVNKKIQQAFAQIGKNIDAFSHSEKFFLDFESLLKTIFKDGRLKLIFDQDKYEFYIHYGDGRSVTFNELSAGFSAFLSIVIDLIVRIDLIRRNTNSFSFEPSGIVLIDEPETHFHIEMQYEILPFLTTLFPKIQFVIATHSPAVISSLKDAIVYDLTSKSLIKDTVLGSSYSELMITHFGLENEFSNVADKIIYDVREAVKAKDEIELKKILVENEKYLTPSLRLEIESQIILIESGRSK